MSLLALAAVAAGKTPAPAAAVQRAASIAPVNLEKSIALPAPGSARRLPHLNIVPPVSVSGISSGADLAVQFHIANSDLVSGSGVFAGQAYSCAVVAFDGEQQRTCGNESSTSEGPGCVGMPWGPAPCIGCSPGLTVLYDKCKHPPGIQLTQMAKLVAIAMAAAAAGAVPPLANLADDRVFLYRGQKDSVYEDGTVNNTRDFFLAVGVSPEAVHFEAGIPSQHCMPTVDPFVPTASCGQARYPGAPPAMENCGYDGAGAALQFLYGDVALTPPSSPTAFNPASLRTFSQRPYEVPNRWSGQGTDGHAYIPAACAAGAPCSLHVALHGCGMSASNTAMNMSFVLHAGYNPWAEANGIVVLYPQMGGYIDRNETGPSAQLEGACFDGYGQTGLDYTAQAATQMLPIRNMIEALGGRPAAP